MSAVVVAMVPGTTGVVVEDTNETLVLYRGRRLLVRVTNVVACLVTNSVAKY